MNTLFDRSWTFHGVDGKFYFTFRLHFGQLLQATSLGRLPKCNRKTKFANYTAVVYTL